MNEQNSQKLNRSPRLVSRSFAGETVIVDPDHNVVRMLNGVGSRIWELADGTRTVQEIVLELTREYDAEAAQVHDSVVRFVEQLEKKELLRFSE